ENNQLPVASHSDGCLTADQRRQIDPAPGAAFPPKYHTNRPSHLVWPAAGQTDPDRRRYPVDGPAPAEGSVRQNPAPVPPAGYARAGWRKECGLSGWQGRRNWGREGWASWHLPNVQRALIIAAPRFFHSDSGHQQAVQFLQIIDHPPVATAILHTLLPVLQAFQIVPRVQVIAA